MVRGDDTILTPCGFGDFLSLSGPGMGQCRQLTYAHAQGVDL